MISLTLATAVGVSETGAFLISCGISCGLISGVVLVAMKISPLSDCHYNRRDFHAIGFQMQPCTPQMPPSVRGVPGRNASNVEVQRIWQRPSPPATVRSPLAYVGLPSAMFSRPTICGLCATAQIRSEEHTSELQSHLNLVCRLL